MKASEIRIFFVIIFIDILHFGSSHTHLANIDHNIRHQHHNVRRLVETSDYNAFDLSDKTAKSKPRKSSINHHYRPAIKLSTNIYLENIPGKILKNESNIPNPEQSVINKTPKSNLFEHFEGDPSRSIYRDDDAELETYNKNDEIQLFQQRSESEEYNDFQASDVLQKSKSKVHTNARELNDNFDFNENYVSADYEFTSQAFINTRMEKYGNSFPKRRSSYFEPKDAFATTYIPGSLTKHKFETLGTHDAVQLSRKSHITNHHLKRDMAKKHARKVDLEGRCKWPKPKIEKIQKETSKIYVPHCTVLHRCADDTGCCIADHQTCVAKHTENVSLYFFVKSLGPTHGTVEMHTFINHTECECVDRIHYNGLTYTQQNIVKHATKINCVCPRLFETVLQGDGCRCDCSSGNSGCDSLKRGMEHFSLADRKCINEGRCKIPTCEYGFYIRKKRFLEKHFGSSNEMKHCHSNTSVLRIAIFLVHVLRSCTSKS